MPSILFHAKTFPEARKVTTREERRVLIRKAVATATHLTFGSKGYVIIEGPNDLKIIVNWSNKTIYLMAKKEVEKHFQETRKDSKKAK